ncbi:EAL domain-containing protein [Thalassotalea euphylliae]|uniref:EAL domain-containing protein n=1 Tax=Thalassotalea euphylliae TaxID=1655234 RepID=A0A3E0UD46_9GAMM|nr:EAL domain-containing protein [Thalassotalea euphylliae]
MAVLSLHRALHRVFFFWLLIAVSISSVLVSKISHASHFDNNATFQQFTTSDGLSQSYVFSIVQDSNGFLWFATADGLNRYDGFEFVHYRHNVQDPNSVADNYIRTLFIDSENTLWVGTKGGLSRFNPSRNNFDNFTTDQENALTSSNQSNTNALSDNTIWTIYEVVSNVDGVQLLVATESGLHKFNTANGQFTRIENGTTGESFKAVKSIYQDDKKNIWLGTFDDGVYLTNQSFSLIKHLKIAGEKTSQWNFTIDATSLFDIKEIAENYWLATDNGIFIVDKSYQLKHHITQQSTDFQLLSNQIRTLLPTQGSKLWLGTKEGINAIDLLTLSISQVAKKGAAPNGFEEPWVMTSYQDKVGNLWFGTYGGGIQKHRDSSKLIKTGPRTQLTHDLWLTSFAQDSTGTLWFSNESGELFKQPLDAELAQPISLNIEVAQVHVKDSNSLWLKSYSQELFEFNTESLTLRHFQAWIASSHKMQELVALNNHLCQIDSARNVSCLNSNSEQVLTFLPDGEQAAVLLQKHTNDSLLVLTESQAVYKFSVAQQKFEFIYSLADIYSPSVTVSHLILSQGSLWLASNGKGLTHIDLATSQVKNFIEGNGLGNSYLADLLMSPDNQLWFATNKGIGAIDVNSLTLKQFDIDYGLDHIEFNSHSALLTKEGWAYFGSPKGYVKFKPQQLFNTTQSISTPVISKVNIANKNIEILEQFADQHFPMNLANTKAFTIGHRDFPLSFDFVAPNAKLKHQTRYRYRLLGLEESWVEADNENRRATYTNLSSGEYTFEVEVFDHFDPTLVEGTKLSFTITPPWWLDKSAVILYGLAGILLCAYFLQQLRHRHEYHYQIKKSEERLKLSLWGSGDEMWDWNIRTQKIFRSNIWGILEFPQDGTRNVGTEQTNIHPNDIKRVTNALEDHFDSKTEHYETTYRVLDKQENWVWVLDRGKVVERNEQGKPLRMTGTLKDVSQIKKAEERLKLFAKCIENISDAVVIYDRQFNTIDVNKSFSRITGRSKADVIGEQLQFNRYPANFTQSIKKQLVVEGSWQGEIESLRHNNELYYCELTLDVIRDEGDNISHFVGVFSDITSRKASDAELRRLANSDTLTGLPNRSYFQANQQRLVKSKTPHALLVFDLDNFKKINDSMGHQVGDLILVEVAKRIARVGGKRISVYRLGGDEFSIIIENTNDIHTVTTLAKEILNCIAQPLKLKNQEIVLFSSIGIVLYPEDGATPAELLKNADTAMYHAKGNGGNRYQFFSDSMNKQAVKRIQIETLIRHGLKEDYFSVFYQPKIDIASGKVSGMEALVRFETPTKGIISPLAFIPISEETGQIIDIGEIVLRKSCFATKRWIDAGLFDGRVAVNLSAVQFTQPNLPQMIANILEESQLPAKHLELEITEGTVMDSPQQAIDTMLQIRSMGIHLALDDFGTGYSSLAYLKKFPLNTLKIDKAFVDDIESSDQGRNMVATIVTIAHNLGMQVVAEGVENNNQLSFLAGLGCEQLQGYLYSKPLPENDFQKYLLSYQITDKSTSFINS